MIIEALLIYGGLIISAFIISDAIKKAGNKEQKE